MKFSLSLFFVCLFGVYFSQPPYTSYLTGDANDVTTASQYGICLMGGATEDDNAMRWFLNKSGGGDIVVIRSAGTNGYNSYFFSGLGVTVNSVETIVINSVVAANDPYVKQQLRNAEAVFIAGGNQFDYVSYWKNTAVDSALNYLINVKKCPIGGTSAGMAVQGQAYFSAAISSITSAAALSNPYNSAVTIGNNDFIHHPILNRVITDTHFDNPDRRGRITTFLARLFQDSAVAFYGISCDEYTAVCIDDQGIAKVFGGFPTYDDNAYFIQVNCILPNTPEVCTSSTPLTWNRNSTALKVYNIKGDSVGANTFDLNTWATGTGGSWQNWSASSGVMTYSLNTTAINCLSTDIKKLTAKNQISCFPNPSNNVIYIESETTLKSIKIFNQLGELIFEEVGDKNMLNCSAFNAGVYSIVIQNDEHLNAVFKIIIQH